MGAVLSSSDAIINHGNVGTDMPPWVLVVFEYSDWQTRSNMMITSKRWWRNTNDISFYRFLSNRLSIENGVYVPPVLPTAESWKTLFREAYKLRNIWHDQNNEEGSDFHTMESKGKSAYLAGERFKVSVFARFRPVDRTHQKKQLQLLQQQKRKNRKDPASLAQEGSEVHDGGVKDFIKLGINEDNHDDEQRNNNDDDEAENQEIEVTLPLHQRLAMIRMSRKLKSNRQALKILTAEGGWFKSRWAEMGDKENSRRPNVNHRETAGGATFDADQKVPQFARALRAGLDKDRAGDATSGAAGPAAGGVQGGAGKDRTTGDGANSGGDVMVAGVQNLDPLTGRVVVVAPDVGLREFSFDSVLPGRASQRSTYDTAARRLVMDFLNGFNATAIVYGQTGTCERRGHMYVCICLYFCFVCVVYELVCYVCVEHEVLAYLCCCILAVVL
jgi:hypothetical protein